MHIIRTGDPLIVLEPNGRLTMSNEREQRIQATLTDEELRELTIAAGCADMFLEPHAGEELRVSRLVGDDIRLDINGEWTVLRDGSRERLYETLADAIDG